MGILTVSRQGNGCDRVGWLKDYHNDIGVHLAPSQGTLNYSSNVSKQEAWIVGVDIMLNPKLFQKVVVAKQVSS